MQMKNMKKQLILSGILLILLLGSLFIPRTPEKHTFDFPAMSTWAAVQFQGPVRDAENALAITQREFETVSRVCNVFDPDSEVSRLNAASPRQPVPVSPEFAELLALADQAWRHSGGAFDVTVKPLMELWGFHRKQNSAPSPAEVAATLEHVGWDKVDFDAVNRTIAFRVPGVKLDFGGIAKGWAVDRAVDAIEKETPIATGLVNLGGNIRTLAAPPAAGFYTIGITDPGAPEHTLGSVRITVGATASSGDYQRFILLDGVKYSHIVDPRTGYPARRLPGVTVIAPSAAMADWLSTAASVAPELPVPAGCTIVELPAQEAARVRGEALRFLWRQPEAAAPPDGW